ncbi:MULTISPECIES: hypothetical protein [unclassified Ensifer]|uniref:hypothetical protein n=1 Tax=unclassified Ensifer TaxID=2633371 RepID=UPI0008138D21|nr:MULTISPECIES: hypothetical protein [unclassified Ensifer]OCP24863.1 hypothetical protein BC361_19875 [Ensifer sp. LC54]OCP25798.1 hypothetical protein BC363_18660 [Ensifer sp. LC384]OCP35927.1 hypothetical protein BC360_26330 [Ensifer sp. LC163]
MKRYALLLNLVAFPAFAQSGDLEAVCATVAKNFLLTDVLQLGIVQSFPELKPPGVRLTYSTRAGVAKSEMSDTFACEFRDAKPPFTLVRFCQSNTCYSPQEEDAARKRRFDEMRILLERSQK